MAESTLKSRRLRKEVIKALGSKCIMCGFSDYRALQVDHINGGGNHQRKALGGWWSLYRYILENPSGYQLLCANCNWIKAFELGEVSGKRYKETECQTIPMT